MSIKKKLNEIDIKRSIYSFIVFIGCVFVFLLSNDDVLAHHSSYHFYGAIIDSNNQPIVRPNMIVEMRDTKGNIRYVQAGGGSACQNSYSPLSTHEVRVTNYFYPNAGKIPCSPPTPCYQNGTPVGCNAGDWVCDDPKYHCDHPGFNYDNEFFFIAWQGLWNHSWQVRTNYPWGGNMAQVWCNQSYNVPGVGVRGKVNKVGAYLPCVSAGGFGCVESTPYPPGIRFIGHIAGCTCQECRITGFSNVTEQDGVNDLGYLCYNEYGARVGGIVCDCDEPPIMSYVSTGSRCEGQDEMVSMGARDGDGSADIQRFVVNINTVPATSYRIVKATYNTATLTKLSGPASISGWLGDCDSFTPGTQTWCQQPATNQVFTHIYVRGLTRGNYTATVTVYDYAGNSNSMSSSFSMGYAPGARVSITPSGSVDEGTPVTLSWDRNAIWGSPSPSCSLSAPSALGGSSSSCSGTRTLTPTAGGPYNATFSASNYCGSASDTAGVTIVPTADAWMMTAWGDTFSQGGYSMQLYKVTDPAYSGYSIPKDLDDDAYFSTYIMSNSNNTNWPDPLGRRSHRSYILASYADQNRNKVGSSGLYNYMYGVVEDKGGTPEVWNTWNVTRAQFQTYCSGTGSKKHVFFRSGNLTFNEAGTYLSGSNDACAFVVSGNVSVNANVTDLEAFILSDGLFSTGTSSNRLKILGGVITGRTKDWSNNNLLMRDIGAGNADNPSEIIIYDAKYLYLLKDILSSKYPLKIREWQYSKADSQ